MVGRVDIPLWSYTPIVGSPCNLGLVQVHLHILTVVSPDGILARLGNIFVFDRRNAHPLRYLVLVLVLFTIRFLALIAPLVISGI